jgi:hypothetical protein
MKTKTFDRKFDANGAELERASERRGRNAGGISCRPERQCLSSAVAPAVTLACFSSGACAQPPSGEQTNKAKGKDIRRRCMLSRSGRRIAHVPVSAFAS